MQVIDEATLPKQLLIYFYVYYVDFVIFQIGNNIKYKEHELSYNNKIFDHACTISKTNKMGKKAEPFYWYQWNLGTIKWEQRNLGLLMKGMQNLGESMMTQVMILALTKYVHSPKNIPIVVRI